MFVYVDTTVANDAAISCDCRFTEIRDQLNLFNRGKSLRYFPMPRCSFSLISAFLVRSILIYHRYSLYRQHREL